MSRCLGLQGGSKIYVQALDHERLNNNIGRSSTACICWLKDLCYDSNALYSLLLVVHESWLSTGQATDGMYSTTYTYYTHIYIYIYTYMSVCT